MKRRILIADDSERTREQLRQILEADERFEVDTTVDGNDALKKLKDGLYTVFVTDVKMPHLDGMQLIQEIRKRDIQVTIIVLTAYGSIDQAVSAIRQGAYDFLSKPVDPEQLMLVINRAIRERGMVDELIQLRRQLQKQNSFQNLVSKSPRMHAVFELIKNVADTSSTILIDGETGTGKEQVARAIHQASAQHRTGQMVAINCAALPENLLESELFGHEKGSFTSAVGQRIGRFEQANGGTLFLDEAGDIPAPMQVKLLRVLQERKFERVGGTQTIEIDVRVIAATNRDLRKMVKIGKFREDLYYRLNVVRIELPPLRERPEDIPLLATHFAARYSRSTDQAPVFSPEAMERLLAHTWPGNIRELENAVERSCITARGAIINVNDLPPDLVGRKAVAPMRSVDLSKSLPELTRETILELEKQYLRKALRKTRGNIGRCARISGLSRRSISTKLAEYQIDKNEFKKEVE